jgi:hypothetical protein
MSAAVKTRLHVCCSYSETGIITCVEIRFQDKTSED